MDVTNMKLYSCTLYRIVQHVLNRHKLLTLTNVSCSIVLMRQTNVLAGPVPESQ